MKEQSMTYTPSYANDEHRRIAAAALRLSHLNTANDVREDAATSSPDRQLGGREAEPDSPIELPQAAFILSSAAESGSVDAEGDVDVDTDRDAEDWRRMKIKMGSSRGSKDSSLRRHDVTSHTCHSHHSYQSHHSHQSRHSQANCHDRHRVDPDHDMEEDEGEDDPIDEPGCSHENAFFILAEPSDSNQHKTQPSQPPQTHRQKAP
ncbi:hypothetical protein MferCBS31731_005505 [Microsporum ferrugineum]